MSNTIVVLGTGLFAEEIREVLATSFAVIGVGAIEELASLLRRQECIAVISAEDARLIRWEEAIQAVTRTARVPYLRAHLYTDRSAIGPWVMPDTPGCVHCAELRMRNVHPNRAIWGTLQEAQEHPRYLEAEKIWTPPFLDCMVSLIADEVQALANGQPLRFVQRVQMAHDGSLMGQTHAFLPHPHCPHCSSLPDDSPELAVLHLQKRLKPHPRAYRSVNPLLNRDHLRDVYYDWRMGLVHHVFRDTYSKFIPITGAEMAIEGPRKESEIGYGRTMTFHLSEMTSILESLERYAGMTPRGKKTVKYGSYNSYRDEAIDPRQFGLHEESQRAEPGYRYKPYQDDLPFHWVYAYSWKQQKPVLIPEQVVYYRLSQRSPDQPINRFVYETSNGCAMGGSLEEAIYYGLLEVIERDAFLVSWYNRLPLVELDISDAKDPTLAMIKDRVEAKGYRLHLFDMTMESGIPSIWATMINPSADAPVRSYTAAGAHPDPEKAVLGALVEVVTSMPIYEISLPPRRDKATAMLQESSQVQTMEDHVLLYSHPDSLPRFDFLFQEQRIKRSMRDMYADWYEHAPPLDFSVELKALLDRLTELHLDVLIVDESTPEMERVGIKAVKVFVLGMMTMTFGHQHRRILLDRVQQAPVQMGYRTSPITPEELNSDPHPFP